MKTTIISKPILIAITLCLAITFQSCDKELDINADYKAYPIVYGLLNTYDSVQTVRINKSFLGNENPSGYASIADSSLYTNVNVDLVEVRVNLDDNGQEWERYESARYPLQKMTVTGKENGTFYNPDQVVYGAKLPKAKVPVGSKSLRYLNQSKYERSDGGVSQRVEYKIEGTVGNNNKLSASLSPIPEHTQDIMTQKPFRNKWNSKKDGNIAFALDNRLSDGIFMEVEIPPFTKITELKFTFNYTDIDFNGKETNHQISQSMGTYTTSEISEFPKDKYEFSISAQRFYELVASQIPDFNQTPDLKHRIPGIVDFEIVVGDAEYYYYRSNTIPSDDLNQLKPQYSNIDGGFGIFASRTIITMSEWAISSGNVLSVAGLTGMWLDKNSQIALQNGYVETPDGNIELNTASKGFCLNQKVVGQYNCPNPNVDCFCP